MTKTLKAGITVFALAVSSGVWLGYRTHQLHVWYVWELAHDTQRCEQLAQRQHLTGACVDIQEELRQESQRFF